MLYVKGMGGEEVEMMVWRRRRRMRIEDEDG